MKLAIVGSRTFNDNGLMIEYIHLFRYFHEDVFQDELKIISGGAKGANSLAHKAAICSEIPVIVYEAEWDKYGKEAGFIRNQKIVDNADKVLAFWDG